MASRITCEVRDESAVTVVRLTGALDLGTMRAVHTVLDRCLTTQPDALVVDLAEVQVADRLALSVFAATARQAADWPAVPVVLCAPPSDAARGWPAPPPAGWCRYGRTAPRRPCWPGRRRTPAAAPAGAGRRCLPAGPGAGRRRLRAVEPARNWSGPASLVLSELVGNVVRHAGTPMQVTLTLRRPYLQMAVADGSRAAARPATPSLARRGWPRVAAGPGAGPAVGQLAAGRRQGRLGDAAGHLSVEVLAPPAIYQITALAWLHGERDG